MNDHDVDDVAFLTGVNHYRKYLPRLPSPYCKYIDKNYAIILEKLSRHKQRDIQKDYLQNRRVKTWTSFVKNFRLFLF